MSSSSGYYQDASGRYRAYSSGAPPPIVVPSQAAPSSPQSPTSAASSSSMTPGPSSSMASRPPVASPTVGGGGYYPQSPHPHSSHYPPQPNPHHQAAGSGPALPPPAPGVPPHVPARPHSTAPYAHHVISNYYGAYQGVLVQPEDPAKPPKVLQCDGCELRFARKHDLNRHRRIHNGEAPYLCGGCNKSFKRSDARKRHWDTDPECTRKHQESENII